MKKRQWVMLKHNGCVSSLVMAGSKLEMQHQGKPLRRASNINNTPVARGCLRANYNLTPALPEQNPTSVTSISLDL